MQFSTVDEIISALEKAVDIRGNNVEIRDEKLMRGELIDSLARTASIGSDVVKDTAIWAVWALSQAAGCASSSIQELYMAMGRGEVKGYTAPAINLRGLTYYKARAAFRAAKSMDAGPVIFEIARSEIGYTRQRPAEYASMILAAAIKEAWNLPVFIQGDHFQLNAKKYAADPDGELKGAEELIREAVPAGFYNIDIDTSTLVDLSKDTLDEQQRLNSECTAALLEVVRSVQPEGITVSVGGEIGEVGKKNSTVEELAAYVDGLNRILEEKGIKPGLSKISVQTGTSHGGVPLPDGSVAEVKLDFDTLKNLSEAAREKYAMSGAVQHGASTLPDELFNRFPSVGTSEIHLATGFQNLFYESESIPADLKERMFAYIRDNLAQEKKPDQTEEQFLYKTRKKAFGPFKQELWDLDEGIKKALGEEIEKKFTFLFNELGLNGTSDDVRRFVLPVAVEHVRPGK